MTLKTHNALVVIGIIVAAIAMFELGAWLLYASVETNDNFFISIHQFAARCIGAMLTLFCWVPVVVGLEAFWKKS